jgi:hypothetical protein
VIDLDDPRWATLRHAYGSARDIPDLLRELEGTPPRRDRELWQNLYGALMHQGDIFPATFAVVPHLVRIAASAGLERRVQVLDYAEALLVDHRSRAGVPADVLTACDSALDTLRPDAFEIFRAAAREPRLRGFLPGLLAACVALHAGPVSGLAAICDLPDLHGGCPACKRFASFRLSQEGVHELEGSDARSPTGERLTPQKIITPSCVPASLADARRLVAGDSSLEWKGLALAAVTVLAEESGLHDLGAAVPELDAVIACSRCGAAVRVADHV